LSALPRRIAILGVGAIGGLLAARLAESEAEIVLIARGETAATLTIDGLHLMNLDGSMEHYGAARYITVDSEDSVALKTISNSVDFAFICGKSSDTIQLAEIADSLLNVSGFVISLQNGLGHADVLAMLVGSERVLEGSTLHGATRLASNEVRWAGAGRIDLGRHMPHAAFTGTSIESLPDVRHEVLLGLLGEAGLSPFWHDEMHPIIWQKLLLNIAINPLAAICGVENGSILNNPDLRHQARQTLVEGIEVARAEGVAVDEQQMFDELDAVLAATAENRCSMLQDVIAGRRTEIDALCGAVVERGESLGIPTPRNEMLATLVRGLSLN
jgi:2-dehydropantoate 2-reductase